jgi:hypothetical protein
MKVKVKRVVTAVVVIDVPECEEAHGNCDDISYDRWESQVIAVAEHEGLEHDDIKYEVQIIK